MIIGLTGSIAVGKSKVLEILKDLSYKTVNMDDISHEVLNYDDIRSKIASMISADVVINNKVDRKKLSSIVFNDKKKLEILNNIVHGKIIEEMINIINNNKEEILIIEVPLLFELNLEKYFDKIIVVYTNKDLQCERIMKRNNIDKEHAKKLISTQMDIDEKRKKTKYIIENEKDIKSLIENTKRIMDTIIKD